MTRYVLVGGGVASAAAVAGLRAGGFDGEVVIISDEDHVPYERPPLSKEFLAGAFGHQDFQVHPESWYADHDVRLRLGTRAIALDPAARTVNLSTGEVLGYDALVLATGVLARTLPGFAGDRVHAIRTVPDAERLASRLVPGSHLAVLGAGFIGCEVAATAAARGVRVTVFEPEAQPLARVLGPELGQAVVGIHADHGVELQAAELVVSVRETATALQLTTRSGYVVECDELLVGVGSVPNTELAVEAGLEVDGGIVTDEYGRTSVTGVWAIGDVAARWHPGYGRRVRVEHHDTAMRHGANAARNLLGEAVPFTDEHYFWSDQYEHSVKAIGHVGAGTQVVRGSVEGRSLAVFSLTDERIAGVVTLDRPRDFLQTRKLLGLPHRVTAEQLADPDFDLAELLPQRPRSRRTETRPTPTGPAQTRTGQPRAAHPRPTAAVR